MVTSNFLAHFCSDDTFLLAECILKRSPLVYQVDALAVTRPLSLTERAVTLALAVSLDNDYFSRHSQSGYVLGLPVHFLNECTIYISKR